MRVLIYYKPEYKDLSIKLRDNYIAHQIEADIISEDEYDDVDYARENLYDEAIFIEDSDTVTIHEIKTSYTKGCHLSEVYYY